MDPKEARFIAFWDKYKDRPWRFRIGVGGLFGLFMLIVFGIKTYYFGDQGYSNIGQYLTSTQFVVQLIGLGLVGGWIYGWIMYKYCKKTYNRIKEKYNGS